MKNLILLIAFIALSLPSYAQNTDKYITEKNVTSTIATLAADDMLGRSADHPEQIEKATAFIDAEFKKIGLKPLNGQTSFRQEFEKQRIVPQTLEIVVDNATIAGENALLVTEKTDVNVTSGLEIKYIPYDATVQNKDQYFFDRAFTLFQDTASCIVLIAPEFKANFNEFKGFFGRRFMSGKKSVKVFLLGVVGASAYSIKASQKIEAFKMTNVVGQLTGKTKPEEIVVFSGHYDHLGIQKNKIDGDSISNGADDDASGTTAVIELARYYKQLNNNNRTLIFVAFTAEEIGGFGSRYFSEQLNPDKVVAMFNIEMIGKASKWGKNNAFITGFERSDFGEILQKNLAGTKFTFKPDPYPEQDLFYRSDNATLARLGVPAHTISTDQIDIDSLYHTVNDEVETLDMKNITATIRAIAISATSIVSGADTPKRIDKTTVR